MVITTGDLFPRKVTVANLKAGEVILTAEQSKQLQEGLNSTENSGQSDREDQQDES